MEAIISGSNLLSVGEDGEEAEVKADVELEEAFLTLTRLPLGLQAKLGLFRTSFGEFNDGDPEEFPEVDPPNVIVNLFGDEGEGWTDAGGSANLQFGNPWTDDITHVLWFGIFNGDNDVAFEGEFTRPVYFTRSETFFEVGANAGMELGLSFATGNRKEEDERLRTTLANVHFEFDYRDPILIYGQGFNFLGEFFLADIEDQTGGTTRSYGGYALGEYLLTREWSVAARFDWSECPGFAGSPCRNDFGEEDIVEFEPGEGREWAFSPILIYRASRFLEFRAQYKHTDRDFDDDTDELLLQGLFIVGFERPDPF